MVGGSEETSKSNSCTALTKSVKRGSQGNEAPSSAAGLTGLRMGSNGINLDKR